MRLNRVIIMVMVLKINPILEKAEQSKRHSQLVGETASGKFENLANRNKRNSHVR